MSLKIAPTLALPLEAATETFGFLAVRGAGKSNAARVLAEEMFAAGVPFVAVDPVGSWFGLRSSRDGKSPGLSIPIFGGKHGDVPLEKGGGALLADVVVDQRLSCVLDLSQFDSEASKKTFLLDFARRLYQRNEEPLHLFLEEADDYIPQRPMRDEAQLLRAWENIVRRGRARGLGITLITQRSAALNKNVLTQVQTLIAMRTTGPQDRGAIEDWLKYHAQSREILESLPQLEDGEAWVWSPRFLKQTTRIRFRLSTTLDSGRTPKLGQAKKSPATLADVDLVDVRRKMAATIEKAKASDPKELQKKIAQLERELAAKPKPVEVKPERVEVPALGKDELARLEKSIRLMEKLNTNSMNVSASISKSLRAVAAAIAKVSRNGHAVETRPQTRRDISFRRGRPILSRPPAPALAALELSGPEQRILDALAWLDSLAPGEHEQSAVAFLAGYTIGGGAFNNPRAALRGKGLIVYCPGDRLALSDAGRAHANVPEEALTPEELQARVLKRLPGPESKILRVLLEHYPDSVSNEELARAAGYEPGGGAFNNPRGRLRSLGLIGYRQGQVVALPVLFLEGR